MFKSKITKSSAPTVLINICVQIFANQNNCLAFSIIQSNTGEKNVGI